MKQKNFFKKLLTLVLLLVASTTGVWADNEPYYNLVVSSTGGNTPPHNSYTAAAEPTINGIQWSVMGNSSQDIWRIGGKNISDTDREVKSMTAMGSAINKVILTVGTASDITVNSLKLIVASDADFSNVLDEVTGSFSANSDIEFTPTSPLTEWDKGAYYSFVFNVSVSGNSNKFVQFKGAKFYAPSSTPTQTYNITYSIDGMQTVVEDVAEGTVLNTILPIPTTTKANYVFRGWLTTTLDATDTEPTYYDISQTLTGDLTLYAVFAKETPGTSTTTTDKLTNANTIGETTSSYSDWSNKTDKSDAVYAGNSAGSNATIQLRSSDNSGIITTTSGGSRIKKVTVDWHSGTQEGRTLDIYGKNTAYESTEDLYGTASAQGTKLGSIVKGTSTELTITGDYTYIGFRSNSKAMFLNSITIDWETGTPATYSNYCTTIVAKLSAELSIDPTEITMALSDEDKTITVTTADGYNGDITVESSDDGNFLADNSTNKRIVDLYAIEAGEYTVTIKASATAEYEAAQVVCNVTVTKNPSEVAFMTDEAEIVIEEQKTFTLPATTATGYDGVITYALSENTCGATIEGATVTVSQKGSVKVTATAPETATFAASEASYTLTVTSEIQPTEVEATLNNSFFGSESTGNIDDAELSGAQDDVIVTITKNTGNKIYVNAAQIRLYKENTMTLTAPAGYVLRSFEFVEPASEKSWAGDDNSANTGIYTDSNKSWTGTSNEVVITFGGTCRIAGLNITLAPGTNVTDAEWATYVTVVNTDFANSTGIKAYKAVSTTDEGIKLEEITEAPKGTAVVIAASEAGYVLTEAASTPADVTGNILKVSDGNITGDYNSDTKESTYYVLGKNSSDEVGFAPLAKGVKLAKGKAYIHKNDWDTATAKDFLPFIINEENSETTSINSIENSELRIENSDYIYNLAGQKVSKDYKGIVVVNGKKFVRK